MLSGSAPSYAEKAPWIALFPVSRSAWACSVQLFGDSLRDALDPKLRGGRMPDMTMGALDGRVALVTGAGRLRGIGRATALGLAQLGADVVVTGTGRDPATYPEDEKKAGWRDVESTAEQIRASGRKALTWTGDVSQASEVARLVDQVITASGASTCS